MDACRKTIRNNVVLGLNLDGVSNSDAFLRSFSVSLCLSVSRYVCVSVDVIDVIGSDGE
jgi:hypothetical protein